MPLPVKEEEFQGTGTEVPVAEAQTLPGRIPAREAPTPLLPTPEPDEISELERKLAEALEAPAIAEPAPSAVVSAEAPVEVGAAEVGLDAELVRFLGREPELEPAHPHRRLPKAIHFLWARWPLHGPHPSARPFRVPSHDRLQLHGPRATTAVSAPARRRAPQFGAPRKPSPRQLRQRGVGRSRRSPARQTALAGAFAALAILLVAALVFSLVYFVFGNAAPIADFTMSDGPYSAGQPIPLQRLALQGSQPRSPLLFLWDFGDGENGTGPAATHTYAHSGDYNRDPYGHRQRRGAGNQRRQA